MQKKKKKVANSNSGFLKPVDISKELSVFLNWTPGEKHSRVEVTKAVCNYVKTNNLQDENDRRNIVPDSKLVKLLRYNKKEETEPLTYFRIQSFLKVHFV